MKRAFAVIAMMLVGAGALLAESASPGTESPDSTPKRSWWGRMFHGAPRLPQYKDPKLRGLDLQLQLSPQPLKLSETRQMEVRVTLTNRGKHAIELNFPTDQRVEI